jgi:ubiquitin carboxyl-terminal hydrolase 10
MLIVTQVPWLSVDSEAFPPRAPRQKRRIPRSLLATEPVVFPVPELELKLDVSVEQATQDVELSVEDSPAQASGDQTTTQTSTPLPSDAPSETASTQPTTPSSAVPTSVTKSQQTPTQPKARTVAAIVPAVPILPPSPSAGRKAHRDSVTSQISKLSEPGKSASEEGQEAAAASASVVEPSIVSEEAVKPAPMPTAPKSWANLFRSNESQAASVAASTSSVAAESSRAGKNETLSDVLNDMSSATVAAPTRVSFLKPRGLVNTGNMCYMNSVRMPYVQDRLTLTKLF